MTDADVIAAIRKTHLKANIDMLEWAEMCGGRVAWEKAWIDHGGAIFGPGPYLKVPIEGGEWDGTAHRVYAPAKLRRRLAQQWKGRR